MTLLPDIPRSAAGGNRAEAALLQAVAGMRPGWTVLRDCALPAGDGGALARVRYALLHPRIGVALLDVLPGATTADAADRLRRALDAAGFRRAFGNHPPVVYLCVPARTLSDIGPLLAREFERLPPPSMAGGGAWVAAARRVLTDGRPLGVPGQVADEAPLPPARPSTLELDEGGWSAPRLVPGLRGLAVFWGAVALLFGGGAVVLQYLGPPEGPSVAARAGGAGAAEPRATQAASEEAWLAPARPGRVWPPAPGPVLALWPAEPLPTRFEPAHAGMAGLGTGDVAAAVADPRPGVALGAAGPPDRPHRPPLAGGSVEERSFPVAQVGAGGALGGPTDAAPPPAGAAGNTGDPAGPAPESPLPAPRAVVSGEQADGGAVAGAAAPGSPPRAFPERPVPGVAEALPGLMPAVPGAGTAPRDGGPVAASDGASAPAEAGPRVPANGSRDAVWPASPRAAAASAPAADASGQDAPAEAATSDLAAPTPTGAPGGQEGRTGLPTVDAAAGPGVPETAAPGPDGGLSAPRAAQPDDPAAAGAGPAAAAVEPAAPADAAPLPAPATAGGAPSAPGAAGPAAAANDPAAAARPAGPETPLPPDLGTAAPAQAFAPPAPPAPSAAAPSGETEAPSAAGLPAREEGDRAATHARPRPEEAGSAPAAGAAPDAPAPAVAASPAREVGAAPAAPPAGSPEGPSAIGAAAARPGASPDDAQQSPAARRAEPPAQSTAGVPVARPATPEPGGRAPAGPGEAERRAPVASPAAAPPPAALVEVLIARGDAMVARHDISAARLLYERAAAADPRAAVALARTYDPAWLAEIGARGIRGDPALATAWYRKAIALGDAGASARLEALNRQGPAAQGRP